MKYCCGETSETVWPLDAMWVWPSVMADLYYGSGPVEPVFLSTAHSHDLAPDAPPWLAPFLILCILSLILPISVEGSMAHK